LGQEVVRLGSVLFPKGFSDEEIRGKLFNLQPSTISVLRRNAFEHIIDQADENSKLGKDVILAAHLCFRRTKAVTLGLEPYQVLRFSPDKYFTTRSVTDDDCLKSLSVHPAWKGEDVTLYDVSRWRQDEEYCTRLIAGFAQRPWQPITNLDSHKKLDTLLYGSMPQPPVIPRESANKHTQTVFVTAMSGVNARAYLKAFAALKKGRIGLLDVGEKIVQVAKRDDGSVTGENILEREEKELFAWRATAIAELLVHRSQFEDCIILEHVCFYEKDKDLLLPAFNLDNEARMMNAFDPTVFITMTDSLLPIKKRQFENAYWRKQDLSLQDISVWREEEAFFTRFLASLMGRPHFLIPVAEPFQTMDRVIFGRDSLRKFYLSFPITEMLMDKDAEKYFQEKDKIRDKLRQKHIVFDPFDLKDSEIYKCLEARFPLTLGSAEVVFDASADPPKQIVNDLVIEKGNDDTFTISGTEVSFTKEQLSHLTPYNYQQIVERDFQLIEQSDAVVVYYPITTVSSGVLSEIIYAYSHGRDTYVRWASRMSPFLDRFATRIFQGDEGEKELLDYLMADG